MANRVQLVCMWLIGMALGVAYATDPNQLQDFCVAVDPPVHGLFVNGLFCKNPNDAKPEDFLFRGLNGGNTNNELGFNITRVTAAILPGLNTLSISLGRLNFAPYGVNPPHIHPRATQILTVIEGTLYVGFVASDFPNNYGSSNNTLFSQVLMPGDVFVFPQGLIHFERNIGDTPAVAIDALTSQNPGVITIANAVFGPTPSISDDVLSKAFHVDPKVIDILESPFTYGGAPRH